MVLPKIVRKSFETRVNCVVACLSMVLWKTENAIGKELNCLPNQPARGITPYETMQYLQGLGLHSRIVVPKAPSKGRKGMFMGLNLDLFPSAGCSKALAFFGPHVVLLTMEMYVNQHSDEPKMPLVHGHYFVIDPHAPHASDPASQGPLSDLTYNVIHDADGNLTSSYVSSKDESHLVIDENFTLTQFEFTSGLVLPAQEETT